MKKKTEPKKIEGLVWSVLRSNGYENIVKEQQVLIKWAEIVGEKIASQTEAVAIENKCLFVKASNPAWRNELIFLKSDIIKNIYKYTGKKLVNNIIFTVNGKGEIK